MFGLKLMHIHEPDANYLVRVCVETSEARRRDVVPGSVVKECDECGVPVWYSTTQAAPVIEDVKVDGEVILCMSCCLLHQLVDDGPPKWLGPMPGDFPT